MSPTKIKDSEKGEWEEVETQTDIDMEYFNKLEERINQNSSTAMGTNHHGVSHQIDLDGGFNHNISIDQKSPASIRSKKSLRQDLIKGIQEEEHESNDGSKKYTNLLNQENLRSNQTLPGGMDGHYNDGSEFNDGTSNQLSPSLKSLMKSKQNFEGPESSTILKEAYKQNNKKVKGNSTIKSLIRSAATRHNN